MIYIIIYIIGFLICYYYWRYESKVVYKDWNWKEFQLAFKVSLLLWYIVVPLATMEFIYDRTIGKLKPIKFPKEPPKWL